MELSFNIKDYDIVSDIILKHGGSLEWFMTDDLIDLGDMSEISNKELINNVLDDLKENNVEYKIYY